jgi:hypothetical protein
LDGLDVNAADEPMSRSFGLFFVRFVEVDGNDGIAFMAMTLLTLASSPRPLCLYLVGRSGRPAPTKPAPASFDRPSGGARQHLGVILKIAVEGSAERRSRAAARSGAKVTSRPGAVTAQRVTQV